jgi:Holliday junction resolvasome RuvABC endonuclease subunit
MRIALGIDPSLAHTGVCRLREGKEDAVSELTTAAGTHRAERLVGLRERLRDVLMQAGALANVLPPLRAPVVVAMETEIWMSAGHTASESAAVQAIFQVLIWETRAHWRKAGWPTLWFLPVNVSQLKKWVDAKEKQHVLMKVLKLYGREFTNDNLADAFVLAQIADAYSRVRSLEVPMAKEFSRGQLEVLAKLSLPWEVALPPVKIRKKKKKRGD